MLDVFLNDTPIQQSLTALPLHMQLLCLRTVAGADVLFNRTVESERKTKTWHEHMVFHHLFLRCYHPFSVAMTVLPVHDLLISILNSEGSV